MYGAVEGRIFSTSLLCHHGVHDNNDKEVLHCSEAQQDESVYNPKARE
jgi:hypothetical protein